MRGKTGGRGTKGQKSRSGHRIRPEIRDLIKKLPKRRGYREARIYLSRSPVNLGILEKNFEAGDAVTPSILVEKGIVRRREGKVPEIKILGTGELTKKLVLSGMDVSASAREKILKVGGEIK